MKQNTRDNCIRCHKLVGEDESTLVKVGDEVKQICDTCDPRRELRPGGSCLPQGKGAEIVWLDGSKSYIGADGIIVDADAERERGREAFINDEVFDFHAQSELFQEGYKEAWFEITQPPNYGDMVDTRFDEHLTELHWDYQKASRCTDDKGCGETPCICRLPADGIRLPSDLALDAIGF